MPAALVRGGRAVSLPVAQGFGHASKETRGTAAEAFAYAPGFAEALNFGEGIADALGHPIAEATAHPKVIADPEVLPDTQADPGSET